MTWMRSSGRKASYESQMLRDMHLAFLLPVFHEALRDDLRASWVFSLELDERAIESPQNAIGDFLDYILSMATRVLEKIYSDLPILNRYSVNYR